MYNSPHYQLSIKKMLDKIIEIIMTILPFLGNRKKRKAMAQDVKEFSELVKDQYTFLMEQLEKVLKDYFDLSARVKEMHTEIFSLREQLAQAATLQCVNKECLQPHAKTRISRNMTWTSAIADADSTERVIIFISAKTGI